MGYENDVLRPAVIAELKRMDYIAEIVHGGMYQQGFPDLYVVGPHGDHFWIELKSSPTARLRHSQLEKFNRWTKRKVRVYIVHQVEGLARLISGPPNWHRWIKT